MSFLKFSSIIVPDFFVTNSQHWRKSLLGLLVIVIVISPSALCKDVPYSRQFTTEINPQCSLVNCTSWTNISLVHITSQGENDNLHFIWSFIGAPTLLLARTPIESKLNINWNDLLNGNAGALTFQPYLPFYTFGWMMTTVWIYNDENDQVKLNKVNQSEVYGYNTNNFKWERADNESITTSNEIRLNFISTVYMHENTPKSLGDDGYFKITIRMKNSEDYGELLPYMMHNGNNTQVDIAFNKVNMNFTEEHPIKARVGFNYIFIQDDTEAPDTANETMTLDVYKGLDDEHTPGVFETYSLKTPIIAGKEQSYMQWKPICYTAEQRSVENSIEVTAYKLTLLSNLTDSPGEQIALRDFNKSIFYAYYGSEINNLLAQSLNISFGIQQDGFYNKTKHISWTYTTGYGIPPNDQVSLLVMLVISIGLGLPTLIIIFAVLYFVKKRLSKDRDDLLLGG